jgi:predicted acetylornithine/succinylornithine family transaminase
MAPNTQELLARAGASLIGNYARMPVVMHRGEGSWLWDTDGNQYLDLFAGFGGGVLGHCHPALVQAAVDQAKTLWHVGNTFHSEPQIELAERLKRTAFDGRAFFCHSGLEANEAAVKLARLRGAQSGDRKKWKVVSFNKSFHGRSLAMIAATGNPAVKAGFEPGVPGFDQVNLGDLEGLMGAISDETCAVIVEPIQGEGGIHPVPLDFAIELRKLCDARQITLIFDEVWTGCGRTGKWFGHQYFADAFGKVVQPDIMTLGKAVGGGLPVGVMFAKPEIAALLTPGKHGCTLGGNPICMNVSKTIFDVIEHENLIAHANELGAMAVDRLTKEPKIANKVAEVRGRGLFLGIELRDPPAKFLETALANRVVINLTSGKVIRLAPPINITKDEWADGLERTINTIAALEKAST